MLRPMTLMSFVAVGLGACAAGDLLNRARADGDTAIVTIPNMMFMSFEKAQAAAKSAGIVRPVDLDNNSLCGSAIEGRIVELGQVCSQSPAPGTRQGARLPVTVRTQTEDPRHGNLGKITEWHLMPNVVGMTQDAAMAKMRDAGFTDADYIQIGTPSDAAWASCEVGKVCSTYPNAVERAGQHSTKTLFIKLHP